MASEQQPPPEPELRLVLLGRAGAGQTRAGDAILGRPAFQHPGGPEEAGDAAARCQRHSGRVGGRQVVVVTVPDWFSSRSAPADEARALVSSFVALSSPGPHAFLLCVPADRPSDGEERALAALELILGPTAVTAHTLVLFTHGEEEEEEVKEKKEQTLEVLLSTKRRDLLELVDTCGGRYHALRRGGRGGGGEEEEEREEKRRRKSIRELLGKVEKAVGESPEEDFFTCALYKEAGQRVRAWVRERVRERREELARQRREEEEEEEGGVPDDDDDDDALEEEEEEAQRSVVDLDVDIQGALASVSISPAASPPPPSLLWRLWGTVLGWLRRVPQLLRLEALFGSLVGLFVGGPAGKMLGATAGSVANE
ncbi:hypothetical protein CRUP_011670, partial [Coryphaenoides rupestris]